MAYYKLAISSLLFMLIHIPLAATQPQPWQFLCNDTGGNYTANSTYRANIQNLATSLPDFASSSPSLFAAGKSGIVPDAIYALALCRGDTNASSCVVCVSSAIQMAQELCPLIKEVTIYNDPCILRFSNQDFPHNPLDNRGKLIGPGSRNVSSTVAPSFFAAVGRLVNATFQDAAADPVRRFSTGEEAFDETYPEIYALAQCTPDLTAQDCRTCLWNISVQYMPEYFFGSAGGRVFAVRCNFRYETYPFFNSRPLVQLQSPFGGLDLSADRRKDKRTGVLVAIIVPSAAAVLSTLVTCLYFWRRQRRQAAKLLQPNSTSSDDIPSIDSLLIDLSTLQVATDNFGEHKSLGEGGFGVVYKGDLPDGQEIAVKRLSETSRQGIEELKTELLSVAKLNHKNLVRLVGVCLEEREKILVYETMSTCPIEA